MLKKIRKNKRLWETISVILICLILYLTFKETNKITAFLLSLGNLTPILTIVVLTLLGITPIATDPIVMLMGITYGPFWGMVIGAIGNTLAMFLGYFFGAELAQIFNYKTEKKKLPLYLRKFPTNSWIFLIVGRMIPGYGSKFVSIIAGADKVNLYTYFWTSLLSGLIGGFVLSYGGYELLYYLR